MASQSLIIIISVVAGVFLGALSNWVYDLLKALGFFPERLTIKRLVVVIAFSIPFIILVAIPAILAGPNPRPPTFNKIAFATRRDGNPEIYLMDAEDGSDSVNLTMNGADDWAPAWSPDGMQVTFISYRDGANAELYVMDSDGSNPRRISNTPLDEHFPAWSPDGKKIAFTYGPELQRNIYVMDANGNNRVNLTNDEGDNLAPAWSPDGSKIAFHSFRTKTPNNSDIYAIDSNGGGELVQLTDDPSEDSFPAWSPNGERIAFVSARLGNHEIFTMYSDGRDQIPLTRNGAKNYSPSWSPDGNRVVFHTSLNADPNMSESDLNYNLEIYTILSDGSQTQRLTNNLARDSDPNWSPSPATSVLLKGIAIWLVIGMVVLLSIGATIGLRRRRSRSKDD
jgi:Tol biopolymer transport system component